MLILSELKLHLSLFLPLVVSSVFLIMFVAAIHSLVNVPALQDGQGFTVMRRARLDTTVRDACCHAAAAMEQTATLSQVPVYVPLDSW